MRASRESGASAGGCTAGAVGTAARGGGDIAGAFTSAGAAAGAGAGGADEQPTKTASDKKQKAWRIRSPEVVERLGFSLDHCQTWPSRLGVLKANDAAPVNAFPLWPSACISGSLGSGANCGRERRVMATTRNVGPMGEIAKSSITSRSGLSSCNKRRAKLPPPCATCSSSNRRAARTYSTEKPPRAT